MERWRGRGVKRWEREGEDEIGRRCKREKMRWRGRGKGRVKRWRDGGRRGWRDAGSGEEIGGAPKMGAR